jgi:hypothetical protein
MADRYWILGTGTWDSTSTTNWSASSGGAGGASVPTAADNVFFDANSNVGTTAFTVTMATTPRVCNDFTASGLDGVMTLAGASIGLTVSGSLTFQATNFTRTYTGTTTFNATTTGKTVTTNGVAFNGAVIFNGVGGGWTLGSALTNGVGQSTQLTNGTLDLSSYTLSTGFFSSSNANTRTIAFSTGQITVSGTSATIWTTSITTGLTTTGTQVVNITNATSTSRTILSGSLSEANSISFNISGALGTVTILGTASETVRNLDFTGFGGTLSTTSTGTIYGNLKFVSGMTLTVSGNAMTFGATSGTQQITSNTKTIDFPFTFNGIGGTFQLQDDLTMGSTRTVQLTGGTLDLNGKTFTAGTGFVVSGTSTRNLTFNGGTVICPAATTTAFNCTNATGLTTTAGTGEGTISMTAATAKGFNNTSGTNIVFNCTLQNAGAGALTITGSNTFTSISNSVQPTTFTFTAGTTTTVTNWKVNGTAGNLVTIGSVTAASHTLSKASGVVSADYLSISRSTATGGATWYAGANSTNGGNNSGWIFNAPVTATGNFLVFF